MLGRNFQFKRKNTDQSRYWINRGFKVAEPREEKLVGEGLVEWSKFAPRRES